MRPGPTDTLQHAQLTGAIYNGLTATTRDGKPARLAINYVIWRDGVPFTEVQCIPTESRRWYSRGSGLKWYPTRQSAIAEGIKMFEIGRGISGGPLPVWSIEADAAIKPTKNGD